LQHLPLSFGVNACTGNDSTINLDRYPADQVGYLCLGIISGNPDDESPMHQHWYEWPAQRNRAIDDLESWAERGFNTYVVPCLFSETQRAYDTALPSAWLWLDDVAVDGAELVESSEGNYQSWLKLDRPITARERQHLQAAIRDQHPGADACSKDAIHFARAVGGWNTKRTPWQVRLVRPAMKAVSVDALLARYGQPSDTPTIGKSKGLLWEALPNGAHLAQSTRFVRLRANNAQLERVCTGLPVPLMMKNGHLDNSLSNARAVFVYQLIRAKYPLEESQALYEHFADMLSSGHDFYTDFERLWWHYQPATYRPEPTRSLQPAATVVAPIGGRHYEITAAELLDYYASIADSGPMGTRADVTLIAAADALGVSVSTIRRREAELIGIGQIRRCVTDDRQSSYVMIGAYVCSQPIVMPDQPDSTPIAPPVVADTAAYVCSQLNTPHPDAENVPVAAVCEECAHVEITYTTSNPTAAPQRRSAPDSSPCVVLAGGYVLSPTVDEPQTSQFADDVDEPPTPAADDLQAASYEPSAALPREPRTRPVLFLGGWKDFYRSDDDIARRWKLRPESEIAPESDAGDMFDSTPRPIAPQQPAKPDKYGEKIARMDMAALLGEQYKHKATLKKHAGAGWLADVRRKLRTVEQAIMLLEATQQAGPVEIESDQADVLTSPMLVEPPTLTTAPRSESADLSDLLTGLDVRYLVVMHRTGNVAGFERHCKLYGGNRNPADIRPLVAALA
jgi:hypothetical protein